MQSWSDAECHNLAAVPSGPNSVPQPVLHTPTSFPPIRTPSEEELPAVLDAERADTKSTSQCSTRERPPQKRTSWAWLWTPPQTTNRWGGMPSAP